ncbi:MAG: hypothetical protein FWF37_01680 [Chloroflexi bacterium]|nr:hypothetical protein [Chloroflexota bacterium]
MNNKNTQSRKWLLTINNPLEHGLTHDAIIKLLKKFKNLIYYVGQDEIGTEEKTPHTHVYFKTKNGVLFSTVKKLFPTAHIEQAKGSSQDNYDYITKTGKHQNTEKATTSLPETFFSFGDLPTEEQGKRTDLEQITLDIQNGKTPAEILRDNPHNIKYANLITRANDAFIHEEDHKARIKFEQFRYKRRPSLHVIYIEGAPGIGKTRTILDLYGDKNVYSVKQYSKYPFDTYRGQNIILFDDFDCSNFTINQMLELLDIYYLELPNRYENKVACWTIVFIVSNLPFSSQYSHLPANHEHRIALERRIHKFIKFDPNMHYYLDEQDRLCFTERQINDDDYLVNAALAMGAKIIGRDFRI